MKRLIAIVLILCCTVFSGCASQTAGQSQTITQLNGSTVTVPQNPKRLAAVYGPSYETLVVLGAEQNIVVCADVQTENFPWAKVVFSGITTLPCLQNVHSSVNCEELLRYKPDLVFTFARPNELNQLKKSGIAALPGITDKTLNDIKDQLMVYATALDETARNNAKRYIDYFDQKLSYIKSVTDKIPSNKRPSVYYAGADLLTTYGNQSDIPELIEAAGGVAVTKALKAGNRTQINFEQLVSYNPDFIFIDHGGMKDGKTVEQIKEGVFSDGRYSTLSAVSKKQVYLSPSGVFYWDMGLQKILLLMYIAKQLHPEQFQSLNMEQEVTTFYQTFFHYPLTKQQAQKILNRQNP